MNETNLSGWLIGKPIKVGEGDKKGIRFMLRTVSKYRRDGIICEATSHIPCVSFKCPEKLSELLLSGKQKLWIEGSGRLAASSYETPEGRQHSLNVVFDAVKLTVMEV